MLKARLIFMLSWTAFAWANFVVGPLVIGGVSRDWRILIT